jgi:hypothetical protein
MTIPSLAQTIGSEVGVAPEIVRSCVTAALRELHRIAVVSHIKNTGAIMETYFCFGPEACYHLAGILITGADDDQRRALTETMMRFMGAETNQFSHIIDQWLVDQPDQRT